MKLRSKIKLLLMTALLFGSTLAIPLTSANAKRHYRYHYRTHRVAHQRYRHHYYHRHSYRHHRYARHHYHHVRRSRGYHFKMPNFSPVHSHKHTEAAMVPSGFHTMRSQRQIKRSERDCSDESTQDVNNDRASVGLNPYSTNDKYTAFLAALSKERSQQIITHFGHHDQNGNLIAYEDGCALAPKYGISSNDLLHIGENIAYSKDAENLNRKTYVQGAKPTADYLNYIMWNKEKGSTPDQDGGHRQNIEWSYSSVHSNTTYDPANQTYYLAEEFI